MIDWELMVQSVLELISNHTMSAELGEHWLRYLLDYAESQAQSQ